LQIDSGASPVWGLVAVTLFRSNRHFGENRFQRFLLHLVKVCHSNPCIGVFAAMSIVREIYLWGMSRLQMSQIL